MYCEDLKFGTILLKTGQHIYDSISNYNGMASQLNSSNFHLSSVLCMCLPVYLFIYDKIHITKKSPFYPF